MSIIANIISSINTTINTVVFPDETYTSKRILGLAWPYPEKSGSDTLLKIVPAIYANNSDEGTIIDLDDSYSVILYHKLSSYAFQTFQKNATGNDQFQQLTADASMIVWALREDLNMQADDLSDLIVFNLPTQYTAAGIVKCTIAPVQTDFDFIRVFRQEYQSVDYFLKPGHILLQIKYRVVAVIKPNCFTA